MVCREGQSIESQCEPCPHDRTEDASVAHARKDGKAHGQSRRAGYHCRRTLSPGCYSAPWSVPMFRHRPPAPADLSRGGHAATQPSAARQSHHPVPVPGRSRERLVPAWRHEGQVDPFCAALRCALRLIAPTVDAVYICVIEVAPLAFMRGRTATPSSFSTKPNHHSIQMRFSSRGSWNSKNRHRRSTQIDLPRARSRPSKPRRCSRHWGVQSRFGDKDVGVRAVGRMAETISGAKRTDNGSQAMPAPFNRNSRNAMLASALEALAAEAAARR